MRWILEREQGLLVNVSPCQKCPTCLHLVVTAVLYIETSNTAAFIVISLRARFENV